MAIKEIFAMVLKWSLHNK